MAERLLAADAILRTVPQIRAFVRAFTFVLVVMKDDGAPDVFASGSTGQFIGRSFLSNPHLAAVSVGEIVESLVHEAIHSLLYMLERDTRWINDPALYDPTPLLASPWTGTRLALRPFLQATFVWYGLINLWSRLPPDSVPPDLLRRRLGQALGGFRAGPLLDHAAPWRTAINPVLAGAVEAAQQRVVLALQEEAPA